jgi:Flp pilus assembly protein TadD
MGSSLDVTARGLWARESSGEREAKGWTVKAKELLLSLLAAVNREDDSSSVDLETELPELALFRRASEAEARGDFEAAVALLRELVELSPSSAAVHNRLAVILAIKLKRYPEALTALRCALALEPDNIVYTSNFATLSKMAAEAAEH